MFEETEKGLLLLVILLGLTHSRLPQCNWNFQSLHHLLASYTFFKCYPPYIVLFTYFYLFNGGSSLAPFTLYHTPPIYVISFWNVSFGLSDLIVVRGILLNIYFISVIYATRLES